MRASIALWAALAVLAIAYPQLVDPYWLTVGILAIFYAVVTASWTLLVGYAGQFSFGHMAFVAIGAYGSALLVKDLSLPIPFAALLAIILSFVVGAAIGGICLRIRGPYLAIFTLAFSEVLRIVIATENEITGGAGGLQAAVMFHGRSDIPYYYVALAILAFTLAVLGLMVRSRWGLFLRAIRENEQAAAASGVRVVRFRILVFAIASSFAGLAGAFYAHYIGMLTPDISSVDQMGLVVAMAVIGGSESLPAAVLGAFAVEGLVEALRAYGQWRLVLFGALLLLTMRFARNGLLALLWDQMRRALPVRGGVR